MARRILVVTALATLGALLALSCKDTTGGATDEAGKPTKPLYCKLNNQCWICPDEAAIKKCIINPATAGCKQASAGECP